MYAIRSYYAIMVDENTRNQRHQARQQRLKEKVDARIQAAQEERGILIVITGDGKGKTTSGFGTVTRAVGHGLKAGVVHHVEAPEERHRVEHQVLEIYHEVKYHDSEHDRGPVRQADISEEPVPARVCVITSYSIHYTKLYDHRRAGQRTYHRAHRYGARVAPGSDRNDPDA